MIDPSFQTFPVEDLKRLVQEKAGVTADDRRRTKALLKDEFPEHQLQIHVLSTALDTDVPATLSASAQRHALPVEAGRLTQMLIDRYGLQEYVARWAVAAWGFAMGLWPMAAVSSSLVIGGAAHWSAAAEVAQPAPVLDPADWAPSAAVTLGAEAPAESEHPGAPARPVREVAPGNAVTDPQPANGVDAAGRKAGGGRQPAGGGVDLAPEPEARTPSQPPSSTIPNRTASRRPWLVILPVGLVIIALIAAGAVYALTSVGSGVHPVWTQSIGIPTSPPVVAGGLGAVGTGSTINAFHPSNGTTAWSQTDPDGKSPFLSSDGNALYASNGQELYSVTGSDGSSIWRESLHSNGVQSLTLAPPVVGSGLVFSSANSYARVYGVSSSDGVYQNYIYSPKRTSTYFQPAVANGAVYIPEHYAGGIYVSSWKASSPQAFHKVTKDSWFVKTGSDSPFVLPTISAVSGAVYLMNNGTHQLYRLNPSNGRTVWRANVGNSPASAVTASGSTLFIASGKSVYARRSADGSGIWAFTAKGSVSDAPVVSNGTVFVGSADRSVYALKASTGKVLWSYKTGGPVRVSPVVLGHTVVVASNDGKLYAFKTSG